MKMKKFCQLSLSAALLMGLFGSPRLTWAQANEWTWIGGSSTMSIQAQANGIYGQPGVYGTLGTPAAGNIPGSRQRAASWTDISGNFWVFGGDGIDANGSWGYLNDIWKFNPQTNEWTWMGGSSTVGSSSGQPGVYGTLGTPAAGNTPGGRFEASCWTDSSGNLWLFGGVGIDADGNLGYPNDLWKFNPQTSQWTWMGGSNMVGSNSGQPGVYGALGTPATGNIPGGRKIAVSWTDSGDHLWLFGGFGIDGNGKPGQLNDLWEFNPQSNQWTWMGGNSTGNQRGVYGTLETPAAGNIPGGRSGASIWTENGGNIWLFGGNGYDANGSWVYLNDIWEFNPQTNEWIWMGGSSTVGGNGVQSGVYGMLGTPAAGNTPGGRKIAVSWTDSSGNLWLFGGYGYDDSGNYDYLNDLWEFNPQTSQWTWIGGSSTVPCSGCSQPGVYGTMGTPAVENIPGGRANPVGWTDSQGIFWLFGGQGYDASGNFGELNDLWEFKPPVKAVLTVTANSISVPYGTTPVLTATITGFVNGDTLSVVSGAPALATTATSASLPGTYPISVGQGTLSAANYSFTFIGGTVTVAFTASVPAKGTLCNGTYYGTFKGNLTVSAGQTCIFVDGGVTGNIQQSGGLLELIQSTVDGNIQQSGGILDVIQSTVDGNLQVTGDGMFTVTSCSVIKGNLQIQSIPAGSVTNQVCGSTVNGNLEFQDNGTAVLIGAASPAICLGNFIDGNLTIQSNTAAVSAVGNTVKGNLTVQSNTAATVVDNNTVSGNLQDQSNTASTQVFTNVIGGNLQCQSNTTISGGGNKAKSKQGQCSAY